MEALQKMKIELVTALCFILPCLMTTLGATLIYFFKKTSKMVNIITLGLASGIMFSASIFSLILPALEQSELSWKNLKAVPISVGLLIGALFMIVLDRITAKIFKSNENNAKTFRFFTAITIHNIPEGMSVGFALGTVVATNSSPMLALTFALGIAIQNFPEGLATALPIYSTTKKRTKSCILAILSGIVEPIFAIAGYYLATSLTSALPWLLSFSAGSMIYVIIEEMTPEIHCETRPYGTWAFVFGFILMMVLDLMF